MVVSDSKTLSEVKEIIRKWWSTIQYERKCSRTNEVYKVVNGLSAEIQLQVKELISLEIEDILDRCLVTKNINDIKAVCNAINGCFDNFIHAASAVRLKFIEVVYFINFGISECQKMLFMGNHSKSSLLELLHSLSRILILVLKLKRIKNFEEKTAILNVKETENSFNIENEFELFVGLSFNIQKLLIMDNILIDTKNNLAMAAILMREISTPDECKLKEYHEKFVKTIPNNLLEECHKINILKFLLCSAIINTWSVNIIDSNSTYIYLKFFISICEKYSSETPIVLNTSRTLLLLLKHDSFKEFVSSSNQIILQKIMAPLLSCIFMLLEHPVACVRHSAKDFLHLLSTITLLHPLIIDAVFKLPTDKRSYFISVGALANEIGSRNLIENHRDLPQQLLNALWDPTVVSHVSFALEFVILKDSLAENNFSEWCEIWIVPLLVSLIKVLPVVAADIEKLLEKIFKKHPNSIFYVTNKWCDPASPEELRNVITALKISHKQGLLLKTTFTNSPAKEIFIKNEDNVETKENLISEKLLEHCLHQRDDDIRITTFSFLIEAHKSTEPYTENDFKLIKYFLKYNLNNQQPATRQKILGLVRKMVMRFSDSKAALMKSEKTYKGFSKKSNIVLYEQFQKFLIEFCFSNIFIGCNFNRLNTVLNILLICFENIKNMHLNFSKIDYYWNKFLIALDSSYEENKELAVTLCKKLDLSSLKANEPVTARSLFKKAFSLCAHMEPPDVLTGSSLLRTLMNLPSAKEVLIKNFIEDHSIEDINYCCIKILTQELKEQLLLAKLDLMTAATCGPMYGILFAIRSIFKNVNFLECDGGSNEINKLYLAQWTYILNELVKICFEMCHLVGCAVNSSSTEEHLPMDFQIDFDNLLCLNFFEENAKEERETSIKNKVKINNNKILSEIIFKNFLNKFKKLDYTINNSQYDSYETLRSLKSLLKENELLIRKVEFEKQDKKAQVNNDLEIIDQLQYVKVKIKKHVDDLEKTVTVTDWPTTAQVILLCAWRSIKEASLYLGDLVSKLPMDIAIKSGLISKDTIIKIGEELKILLCEINHRGAFEHAYIAFTQIVNSLLKCTDKNLSELPQKWLLEIITEIKSPLENQKMKLCSTRRSAGLPFLVQTIICSEIGSIKSSSPSSLHIVMNSLLEITESNDLNRSESKIHALNILRALFKHAQLGEHVASYVSRALMTAIRGSRSSTWSVRNSSSLLFSSLIIRIFGVARSKDEISKKNRMTSRIFFQRYSELYEFLLSEMKLVHSKESEVHGLNPKPSLYLVLLILGRLYPPPTEDPANIDLSEFLPYINMSRGNPIMKIRELGARALVSLIPLDRLINELDNRFSKLALVEDINQNERHGILLQIKALLIESGDLLTENISRDKEKSWINNSRWMLEFEFKDKKLVPFTTLCTYVKVLHIFYKNHFHLKDEILKLILNVPDIVNFEEGADNEARVSPGKNLFLENLFYLKTDILGYNWLNNGSDSSRNDFLNLFSFMLKCNVAEVQAFSLSILCYVLPNAAADIDYEDFNGVDATMEDLLIFQKKENILRLRKEILLNSEIMEFLVRTLNNENHEYFKCKVIHRLWLSVISSLVLNGYVSTHHFGKIDSFFLRIDFAKSLLKSGDKKLSTSSIICYAVYLMEKIGLNGKSEVTVQHRLELFNILNEFSSEEADIRERLAVAEIFNRFYMNFIEKYLIEDPTIMKIWMIPFKLLADEDFNVRTIASEFVLKMQNCVKEKSLSETILIEMKTLDWPHLPLISLKAQECLLDSYVNLLESEHLLNLIIQMMVMALSSIVNQERPDVSSKDEFGVFEKGNPNPFCEELALSDLMCDKLNEIGNVIDLEALLRTSLDRHLTEFIANNFYLKSVANTLMELVETVTTRLKKIESSNNDFSISQVQIRHLREALGLREIV